MSIRLSINMICTNKEMIRFMMMLYIMPLRKSGNSGKSGKNSQWMFFGRL